MADDHLTVRVTNPGAEQMPKGKMRDKDKQDLVRRLWEGKAAKARAEGKAAPKKPKIIRQSNPTDIAGVPVELVLKNVAAVGVGAWAGGFVAQKFGKAIVQKLPSWMQGLAFAAGGAGTILGGIAAQDKYKELPFAYAGAAMAAPMLLAAFYTFGVMPLGAPKNSNMGQRKGLFARFKRPKQKIAPPSRVPRQMPRQQPPPLPAMQGGMYRGMIPGAMSGGMYAGKVPGSMGGGIYAGTVPGSILDDQGNNESLL